MKKGLFITLEGVEGAGKSTAAEYLAQQLQKANIKFILTREPGGTEIAEKIRKVILDHYQEKMHPDTEMLLYFASRSQHLNQVIIPALERGDWVVCDRFTDATYAYQGGGRGLAPEKISILEKWVQGELRPNYTLLFDVDVTIGLKRIKKYRHLDRIETEEKVFFEKVRDFYLRLARQEPERFFTINADKNFTSVKNQLVNVLEQIINNW
jgi:dTMP kinase